MALLNCACILSEDTIAFNFSCVNFFSISFIF
jgi:hypothetical protein